MEIYQASKVFTPTTPARLTFVERDSINNRLVDALATPGKQIVVYGHSGSGKTTLLMNKLHQLYEGEVVTRCITGLTFDQLVADAFDQLGAAYASETTSIKERSGGFDIRGEYLAIGAQLAHQRSSSEQTSHRLILPPQLTAPTLARFLGAARHCWVLEDFHKIDAAQKIRLAQMMKVFMDMASEFEDVRIVAIGAVGTARQVVEYDSEMRNRVAEIHVPLMTSEELHEIVAKGELLLNIKIPTEIAKAIVNYSSGLASICHQLCLNLCQAAGVHETSATLKITQQRHLEIAVQRYLEDASDTLKAIFDRALRIRKQGKFDNTRLIIQAMLDTGEDGATHAELLRAIHKTEPSYPAGNLSHFLLKLQDADRGAIVRFDSSSGRFSFADPIYRAYAQLSLKRGVQTLTFRIDELRTVVLKLMKVTRTP